MDDLTKQWLKIHLCVDLEMKLIFNMFDSNGNGVIDAGELERLLHAMNQNPTPEELEEFLVDLDPEGGWERERERKIYQPRFEILKLPSSLWV